MKILIPLAILLAATPGLAAEYTLCSEPQSANVSGCHFYNVPADQVAKYLDYYPSHGLGLQTLSYDFKGDELLASGAFDVSATDTLPPALLQSAQELAAEIRTRDVTGHRPRQISVVVDPQGQARFTTVWQKCLGEPYLAATDLSDAQFDAYWNDLVVGKGYRVTDYAEYVVAGATRHAAIFVNDGDGSFYFYNRMNRAQLQDQINGLKLKGFRITSLNSCVVDGKSEYAALWQNLGNGWAAYPEMSVAEYVQKSGDLTKLGYRLHKIQAYRNSDRFSAVWKK